LFPWPYGPHFLIISAIIVSAQFIFAFVRKKKLDENNTEIEAIEYQNKGSISFKDELKRKAFHLAGILVPVGYYWIFPLFSNTIYRIITLPGGQSFYEFFWGDVSIYPYILDDLTAPGDLIYFTLWCGLMFMFAFDFIRIFLNPEFSIFHRLLKFVLRKKEYGSVGPQVLLVLGAVVGFFFAKIGWYSYEIAVSAAFTACIADGLVAVLGRRYGKHKVNILNGEKSVEGFIFGFVSAYLCSMIILGPIYAIFAAIIFVLIDIFTIPIADNLLNPILLSIGVWGISLILNIPVGWRF
jgi:dolichol kinase